MSEGALLEEGFELGVFELGVVGHIGESGIGRLEYVVIKRLECASEVSSLRDGSANMGFAFCCLLQLCKVAKTLKRSKLRSTGCVTRDRYFALE